MRTGVVLLCVVSCDVTVLPVVAADAVVGVVGAVGGGAVVGAD